MYYEVWGPWVRSTPLSETMRSVGWIWPICESLHFIGLTLLIGIIGAFDLRVLGVGKSIPLVALHRLLPLAVLGFAISFVTGVCFFFGFPDQYAYNSAFHLKLVFLAIAGLNVAVFYATEYRAIGNVAAGVDADMRNKLIAGVSLGAWVGVMICGRLLTFFRPNFFLN